MAIGFRVVRFLGEAVLRLLNFTRCVDEPTGFTFWWHRVPRTARAEAGEEVERRALVLISGLGHGQALYPHHAYAFTHDPAFLAHYTDIIMAELPGVSGDTVPLRAASTYPTARETVAAFERFAGRVLGLESMDCVAHSGGAFVPSFASRYAPQLFGKVVYAEAPSVFFTHGSKAWPALFTRFTMRRLAWSFLTLDVDAIANWVVMSEVHHQHFIKNATWFMECCHREASGLGERAMLIMGTDDDKVDGLMTAEYFAANHPDVRVHCMQGWRHGAYWDPTNLKTVMKLNREFLCGTSHGSPTTVRAQLGAQDERTAL